MEDQMATIFMGYILVFLVCHSPRLMLNIYELATIREAVECSRYILTCGTSTRRRAVPLDLDQNKEKHDGNHFQ